MDSTAADFALARNFMVDGQVRPNKVRDRRLIAAMRALPRERFLPPELAVMAYLDTDVPLGGGRFLMEPMVIARLLQISRVRPGDRVLVAGAGVGYGAALFAACGGDVTALDDEERLLAVARQVLAEFAPSVKIVAGPLAAGWPGAAPYDIILIEGAVRAIPPQIAAQVAPVRGRLLTVLVGKSGMRRAVLAEPTPGRAGLAPEPLHAHVEFDCATPLLPSLVPAATFQFEA